MSEIFLSGTISCVPDDIEVVVEALPEHVRLSRAEDGCLVFEIEQDESDPCVFHVTERFRDKRAFDAHQKRTRASEWHAATAHMPRDYKVQVG